MNSKTTDRDELAKYLAATLDINRFRDYCPNGLQVEGRKRIAKIVSGVTASLALLEAAHAADVEKFIFLGSSCIYPRDCAQPIKEEYLLTGPLELTNSAYAVAKIAGIELIKSYRKQYGYKWISAMPTNLYGPNDNFDLENSHVFPALIRKFSEAKKNGSAVQLWGTGSPKREFLHVDDLARAVALLLEKYDSDSHINIGTGEDVTIKELATKIATATG